MASRVIATARFADQLRHAPGELRGYVSAVAAVLRVEPTVASAAFTVVSDGEEYTAIFAHGRGSSSTGSRQVTTWCCSSGWRGPGRLDGHQAQRWPAVT